jgi:DNA-binding protein HU-beta
MYIMLQSELEQRLATVEWVSVKIVKSFLNNLSAIISEELKKGWEVVLPWVGKFSTGKVEARTGRNPQTGEAMQLKAYTKVKFKTAKVLKDSVK